MSEKALNHLIKNPDTFQKEAATYLKDPHPSDVVFSETLGKYENIFLVQPGERERDNQVVIKTPVQILKAFEKNAKIAWNIVYADEDDLIRRIYPNLYDESTQEWRSTFALELAEFAHGSEIKPNVNEDGTYLVNYHADPNRFSMIPFIDAYNGFLSDDLKGKIVLIGATTERLKDSFPTPTSQELAT